MRPIDRWYLKGFQYAEIRLSKHCFFHGGWSLREAIAIGGFTVY